MTSLALTLNGQTTHLEVESTMLLVEALRGPAGLTGTHTGCDTSQCGACTVLLDGEAIKSCTMLALQAEGRSVTTIEGLATGSKMHPIQAAFIDKHGLQCGFCTPGMIMTASCLLTKTPHPSDEQIVEALEGNLCRCTGYVNIVAAVRAAAELMATDNAAVQS
jgi:carbon-monoxide dehydrogenase small subunit